MRDLELPSLNRFASDYLQGNLEVEDYFHYDLADAKAYYNRYEELMNRTFMRQELANYIERFMERFPKSEAVIHNIAEFRKEESVVVIGGQQAGLLTGPLYTIHKVISIIKLAEEQEKLLQKRVIPVFWIAGEDHDIAEVNHIYVMKNGKPSKKTFPSYQPYKTMVSDIELDSEIIEKWFEEIVETYGESDFTNELLQNMKAIVNQSKTFVDFFASLIHAWFKDYGLLLVDAGDPQLRKIESHFLEQMIEQNEEITTAVLAQQAFIQEKGYKRMIEIEPYGANLFYYHPDKKDRCLLEKDGEFFFEKNGGGMFTKQQLIQISKKTPELLSNNVVTRPLMQELLFPVLAFISGPGEIAYWAELKRVFDLFSMKMPLIVPRLNITIVERGIETDLQEVGLTIQEVLIGGTEKFLSEYLDSVKDQSLEESFKTLKEDFISNHKKLSEQAVKSDKGIEPILKKNLFYIEQQLDFLYGKMESRVKEKNNHVIRKYSRIEQSLNPLHSPQERIWNIFYYMNKYGPHFISDLMVLTYEFNNQHKLIYI